MGAFKTDNGAKMQPVWCDELGRSSMVLTFPSGTEAQLDQYGRFHTAFENANGETVFRPPMGANDDGGEGFNARLYLVNFPANEYVITVSGAPNLSATGTFAISLTDVSQEDYSADSPNAGALGVGGNASGELETPGDVDWFAVELTSDTAYAAEVRGAATEDGSLGQPRLAGIYDGAGTLIDGTANDGAAYASADNTSLEFVPETDGTYYVAAASFSPYMPDSSRMPAGTYTVGVSLKQ